MSEDDECRVCGDSHCEMRADLCQWCDDLADLKDDVFDVEPNRLQYRYPPRRLDPARLPE
jgi:hypothetical protein